MIKTMKLADLMLDFKLYPRAEVDGQHVGYMCDAIAAGATLPPIVADKASKRIVDGFHRYRAYQRLHIEETEVELRSYKDEAAMFLDAMRYNSGHGRSLTRFDRVHSILRAEEFGIAPELIASALALTAETIGKLRADRVGSIAVKGGPPRVVPLKRTLRHMAGRRLTNEQADTNTKLSGMNQSFYAHQLVMLLETDLINASDERLMTTLERLHGLLGGLLKKRAA